MEYPVITEAIERKPDKQRLAKNHTRAKKPPTNPTISSEMDGAASVSYVTTRAKNFLTHKLISQANLGCKQKKIQKTLKHHKTDFSTALAGWRG